MHIGSIRIENQGSISDSGDLHFSPGFNLVVGPNNVGKSTFLKCLSTAFQGAPHLSPESCPNPGDLPPQISTADIEIVTTGPELRKTLLAMGTNTYSFPWPTGIRPETAHLLRVYEELLVTTNIPLRASLSAGPGQGASWHPAAPTVTRLWDPWIQGGKRATIEVRVNSVTREVIADGPTTHSGSANDAGLPVAAHLGSQVYFFKAERRISGQSNYGGRTQLESDASNLPEVLNLLHSSAFAWREYCALVREVLPTVQWVSVRPAAPNPHLNVEILIWQIDPATKRADLAIPLASSGTGVGQVLAIIYVVMISDDPRTILIDEPGSFLHPGAVRALIGILKRYPRHQYIIATHSPEVIAELSEERVTILRWSTSKTTFEQHDRATKPVAAAALMEIGAKLSDVFGFDRILYVEGPSDADALKQMLVKLGTQHRGVGILPIRDSGAFRRRRLGEVMDLYHKLACSDALLPPAARFVFDREGRTEREIAEAVSESRGLIRFLKRRMFENYLLQPNAIADAYNEAGSEFGIETTVEGVNEWLTKFGGEKRYFPDATPVNWGHSDWPTNVHGANLLEDLFQQLSEARLSYSKTRDTPRLAAILTETASEAARALVEEMTTGVL